MTLLRKTTWNEVWKYHGLRRNDPFTPPPIPTTSSNTALGSGVGTETPSGGIPEKHQGMSTETATEAEEVLEEAEEEEEAEKEPEADQEDRERRSISSAVASVKAAVVSEEFHEVGVFTNTGGKTEGLSVIEMKALKLALNLKPLDKLVATFHFRLRRCFRAFSLKGAYLQDNADLISYLNKAFNRNNPVIWRKLKQHTKNNKSTVFSYNRYSMKCTITLPPEILLQIPHQLRIAIRVRWWNIHCWKDRRVEGGRLEV